MRVSSIVVPVGGHNTRTWNAVLPRTVDWLSRQFDGSVGSATPRVTRAPLAAGRRP